MYYLFKAKNGNQFIQVRDTDLKSTDWLYDWVPGWDESSISYWGDPPFRNHGYPLVGVSPSPFRPMDTEEFFHLHPEYLI